MHFYGFFNGIVWLNNDFQSPHFDNIHALIAACYSSVDAFRAQHGEPENWEKKEISMADIQQIFAGGGQ